MKTFLIPEDPSEVSPSSHFVSLKLITITMIMSSFAEHYVPAMLLGVFTYGLIESSQQPCLIGTIIISVGQERKLRPREMR